MGQTLTVLKQLTTPIEIQRAGDTGFKDSESTTWLKDFSQGFLDKSGGK